MEAFVTGSTGQLGNNLVCLLLEQGHKVKALARSVEKAKRLLGDTEIEIIAGDMTDVAGFASHLNGCDVLFHTAAYYREAYQPGDHWALLEKINVNATLELFIEAERRGVGKVIYASASAVLAANPNGPPVDETAPYASYGKANLYFESKVQAEKELDRFLRTHSLSVVSILPGWMLGPADAAPTDGGQLIIDFMERKLPALFNGGTTVVDSRDVAQAMINSVERGRPGHLYLVTGRRTTLPELAQTLEEATGIPAPRLIIPIPLMMTFARIVETIARLTGSAALVTTTGVQSMSEGFDFTCQKAIKELGISFRPLEETLRDEVNWYKAHGMV